MNIGDRCFIKTCGKTGEIVGQFSNKEWTILIDNDPGNTCPVVNKDNVEPIAEEAFMIGDVVQSIIGGENGFAGIVTGYEPQDNRVVCRSEKQSGRNDRVRYAYKIGELAPNHERRFVVNGRYVWNGKLLRSIEYPYDSSMITLIFEETGRIAFSCKRVTTEKILYKLGYVDIKRC